MYLSVVRKIILDVYLGDGFIHQAMSRIININEHKNVDIHMDLIVCIV